MGYWSIGNGKYGIFNLFENVLESSMNFEANKNINDKEYGGETPYNGYNFSKKMMIFIKANYFYNTVYQSKYLLGTSKSIYKTALVRVNAC